MYGIVWSNQGDKRSSWEDIDQEVRHRQGGGLPAWHWLVRQVFGDRRPDRNGGDQRPGAYLRLVMVTVFCG